MPRTLTNSELLAVLRERLADESVTRNDVLLLARQFTELSDELQADFFEEVGRIMFGEWSPSAGALQIYFFMKHIRTCQCVTDAYGRRLVDEIAGHVKPIGIQ